LVSVRLSLHKPNIMQKLNIKATLVLVVAFFINACAEQDKPTERTKMIESTINGITDTATFGAGCFWCVEAVFQEMNGVIKVTSGYSGGTVKNPAYREVCNGTTGHAEVCQIIYNPKEVTYKELLEAFWQTHDPTTLNRQGNDAGTQYRSVIFYHNEEQKQLAEKYKEELNKSGAFEKPIVTAIDPITNFYAAEDYHQNYYDQNGDAPYCQYVIKPKVDKFRKVFHDKLK
jgi:peptide-methionine (S)-S-oxide reductase